MDYFMGNDFILFWIIYLCLVFIVLLVFREILCWYWKINKICCLLENILKKLNSNHPC